MSAYYNENDPYCVDWLRNLIARGLIADGEVDGRSIRDVQPVDLIGFDQCHFFAGIGGWSYALRLAGWPDDAAVWTGSCPCQPFSAAGKRKGEADERHLWPEFLRLIAACRPAVVFGEQVASSDGRRWLAGVRADLEAVGYDVGAADLCAAGVGAPHIRQRLYWLGHSAGERLDRGENTAGPRGRRSVEDDGRLGDAGDAGLEGRDIRAVGEERKTVERAGAQRVGRLADAGCECVDVAPGERPDDDGARERNEEAVFNQRRGVLRPWDRSDLVYCRDRGGTYRRVEPGTFPLAHGVPARVGRLRAYGNAIVPQVAKEFIEAYREVQFAA